MERNLHIDMLKIVACLGVVALHVFNPSKCENILYYIFVFSIPIFFMVNGFLMLNKKELTYRYCIKKIFNIVTIVFIWNILLCIQQLLFNGTRTNPIKETIRNFIQRGTFFQFWFLGSLIIMDLLLPIMQKFLNKSQKTYKNSIMVCFFICLSVDVTNIILGIQSKEIFTPKIIQSFRLWTWIMYFLLGGYIGKFKDNAQKSKKNICILITLLPFIVIYQIIFSKYVFNNWHVENFYDNIFIMIYIIFVWKVLYSINCENISKVIKFCTGNVMGIYILHPLFINIISQFYMYNNMFFNLIVYFFIVVICGLISWGISKIPKVSKIIKL